MVWRLLAIGTVYTSRGALPSSVPAVLFDANSLRGGFQPSGGTIFAIPYGCAFARMLQRDSHPHTGQMKRPHSKPCMRMATFGCMSAGF